MANITHVKLHGKPYTRIVVKVQYKFMFSFAVIKSVFLLQLNDRNMLERNERSLSDVSNKYTMDWPD